MPALGPTQPPIQWVPGALSPEIKRPVLETDHSPSSSAEAKNGGAIPPPFMACLLIKHRDNFIFTLPYKLYRKECPILCNLHVVELQTTSVYFRYRCFSINTCSCVQNIAQNVPYIFVCLTAGQNLVYNALAFSVSNTLVQFSFLFFIPFVCFFIFPANQLTALNTGPLEKLILTLLSYRTRRFITVFI
jgi:hypothetical protein